jgi:AcrR family transcriptional regulator
MESAVERFSPGQARVVDAALRAWSATYFTNTSLAAVAKELGVSKAALYRHFESKASLIVAMEATYGAAFLTDVVEPLERNREGTLEEFLREYLGRLSNFYLSRPEYYVFFIIHVLKGSVLEQALFRDILRRHSALLRKRLAGFGVVNLEAVERYLPLFGIYWLVEVYRIHDEEDCAIFRGFTTPDNEAGRRGAIDGAVEVCLHGFLTVEPLTDERMSRIERIAWVESEEMLEPDRIFSAIEEVVSEVGFEGATVEKIAERIGMTKSSLYFYFRDKDEMFGKVVEREKEHFSHLLRNRLRHLDTFPEKLYALFVMIAAYSVNNPTQLTVLNWLRYRNVQIRSPKHSLDRMREAFAFLESAREEGTIRAPQNSFLSLAVFPNFLVTREVLDGGVEGLRWDEQTTVLRRLYRLVEGGVAAEDKRSNDSGRIV